MISPDERAAWKRLMAIWDSPNRPPLSEILDFADAARNGWPRTLEALEESEARVRRLEEALRHMLAANGYQGHCEDCVKAARALAPSGPPEADRA